MLITRPNSAKTQPKVKQSLNKVAVCRNSESYGAETNYGTQGKREKQNKRKHVRISGLTHTLRVLIARTVDHVAVSFE